MLWCILRLAILLAFVACAQATETTWTSTSTSTVLKAWNFVVHDGDEKLPDLPADATKFMAVYTEPEQASYDHMLSLITQGCGSDSGFVCPSTWSNGAMNVLLTDVPVDVVSTLSETPPTTTIPPPPLALTSPPPMTSALPHVTTSADVLPTTSSQPPTLTISQAMSANLSNSVVTSSSFLVTIMSSTLPNAQNDRAHRIYTQYSTTTVSAAMRASSATILWGIIFSLLWLSLN